MFNIAVCTHTSRFVQAYRLASELGAEIVTGDETPSRDVLARSAETHDAAWRTAHREAVFNGNPWTVVLEDDAVPVPGFTRALEAALPLAGDTLVSLYFGDQPQPQRAARAAIRAENNEASWISAPWLLWGVGVALPTKLVPGMLASVKAQKYLNPYDERLSLWAAQTHLPIRYLYPSLVDHRDDDSVIGTKHGERRAQKVGTRNIYSDVTVSMI